MVDSNKSISYGSTRNTTPELILFDKKYYSRNAIVTKNIRHHYYEREFISYIVFFTGVSPILIGIYNGLILTRPIDILLGALILNFGTILIGGIIFPYWWGHIKITNTRIIFRNEPFFKFNVFSTLEFVFSSKLVVNYNTTKDRLTFWQEDMDKSGLLILDGLSTNDIETFRKILCDIENIDLTIEKGK